MKAAKTLADCLLRDVYHPVSACVCLDEKDTLISVHLFDTMFCSVPEYALKPCERIVLISHHPDGDMRLLDEDRANVDRIRKLSGKNPELYVYSEYTGIQRMGDDP